MKAIKTSIERREGTNEYGTKVVYEVVELKTPCNKEYVWYETVADGITFVKCSYKTEKRMRKAMEDLGFYNI